MTLIAALTACLAVSALAFAAAGASADDRFGTNASFLWSTPQSSWAPKVQEMQQDGIQVARALAPWDIVEHNAPVNGVHTYTWSPVDAIVSVLAARHILWQPTIAYSAPWAASQRSLLGQPNLFSPPANNADYAAYAQALVKRYGPNGAFWSEHPELTRQPVTAVEIWNEEDEPGYWQPRPDPAAYAAMYTAARSAIHQVAPSVQAITGGIAGQSTAYLQGVYSASGGTSGHLDAVGLHPYATNTQEMYSEVVGMRQVLEQHGDVNVPLDVTEFGWPTAGLLSSRYAVISDAQRAQYVTQFVTAVARSNCGVGRIQPYAWETPEQNIFSPEDWFGVVHPSLARSATEVAYAAAIGQLAPVATPGPPSTALCSQQLGAAASSSQPQASQPQPLLPSLLSPLRVKRLRASHLRSRHGRLHARRSRHVRLHAARSRHLRSHRAHALQAR